MLDVRRCKTCGKPSERDVCAECVADGGMLAVDRAMELDYDERLEEGFILLHGYE